MTPKSGFSVVVRALLMACAMASGAAFSVGDAYALNKVIVDDPDGNLSGTEYLTLQPFVIPIMDSGVHKRQLTVVIAIGLFDDKDRDELRRISPRFRDVIYRILFKMVSFRTAKPRIPGKKILERKLYPAVKRLGNDMVKSIKVHKTILGRRP